MGDDMKKCSRCDTVKPAEAYTTNGRYRDGSLRPRRPYCRECDNAARRAHRNGVAPAPRRPLSPEALERRREAARKGGQARAKATKAARDAAAAVLEALIEDVEFMLTHRESMYMAAQRLGMTSQALSVRLKRAGRGDLASALCRNQNQNIVNQYSEGYVNG